MIHLRSQYYWHPMLHPAQTGTKTEASLNYGRAGDEVHPDYEDEQYDKFLSIPFVENDENDEESMLRRMTSTRLSKFVGCGILLTVVAALATALAYYVKDSNSVSTDDPPVTKVCYENPSCLNVSIYHIVDSNGFTNNTGWSPNPYSTSSCCNICLPGMNSTVCFPTSDSVESYRDLWSSEGNKKRKDSRSSVLKNRKRFQANDDVADCQDKTGYDDYDYVMLDQIYFPQWCNALAAGHDPTLSHLQGSLCTDAVTKGVPLLNIHGLWPNYYSGYPQCCKQVGEDSVEPLDPEDVQTEWETYDELQQMWFDPTTDLVNSEGCNCATCYLLNHEWEKHGSCMGVGEAKELYFKAGLQIAEALANNSIVVQSMNGSVVEVSQIVNLYNHTVNVICDPKAEYIPASAVWAGEGAAPAADEVQVFMEIQSCWDVEIDTFSIQQILDDAEGVLLSGHEQQGAATSMIVDHALVKKAKGGSAGGGVSVVHSLREWRESLTAQYPAGSAAVIDVVTFYGMNCTAAKPSSSTTPCENKYVYVSNYNT